MFSTANKQKLQLVVGTVVHVSTNTFAFAESPRLNICHFPRAKVFGGLCLPNSKVKVGNTVDPRGGRPPTLFWTFLTDGAQPQTFLVEVR